MAIVHVDLIKQLEMEEDRGTIRSMSRSVLVEIGKDELDSERCRNHGVLQLALYALDTAGYKANSRLAPIVAGQKNPFEYLYLTKRMPKLLNDPGWVEVTLKYEFVTDGPNQLIKPVSNAIFFGSGKCSVTEKSTNFYYPMGLKSNPRTQIQVAHTYPEYEVGLVAAPFPQQFPRTMFQGGEISIPFPNANYTLQGLVRTFAPYAVAKQIIRHTNSDTWNEEPPLTWICTEVGFTFNGMTMDSATPEAVYRFTFEFQATEDGADPLVVFNDQRFGRPPAHQEPYELKAGVGADEFGTFNIANNPINGNDQPAGYWKVPALPRLNYGSFFNSLATSWR